MGTIDHSLAVVPGTLAHTVTTTDDIMTLEMNTIYDNLTVLPISPASRTWQAHTHHRHTSRRPWHTAIRMPEGTVTNPAIFPELIRTITAALLIPLTSTLWAPRKCHLGWWVQTLTTMINVDGVDIVNTTVTVVAVVIIDLTACRTPPQPFPLPPSHIRTNNRPTTPRGRAKVKLCRISTPEVGWSLSPPVPISTCLHIMIMVGTAAPVGTTAIAPATTREEGRSCGPSRGTRVLALARSTMVIIRSIIARAVAITIINLHIGRRAMIRIILALTAITNLRLCYSTKRCFAVPTLRSVYVFQLSVCLLQQVVVLLIFSMFFLSISSCLCHRLVPLFMTLIPKNGPAPF